MLLLLLLVALLIASLIASAVWPTIFVITFRQLFRDWPEARASFIGRGKWIAFSQRFGLRWIAPLLIVPFVWIIAGSKLVPDTDLGAWMLFGPAFASLLAGLLLGTLRVLRFVAER